MYLYILRTTIFFLFNISWIKSLATDHLQYNSLRYGACGRYTCPDGGKYKISPDMMYEYLYTLSINSTFDKKTVENSALILDFKIEIRIENCEGVLRVGRKKQKEGLEYFENTGYDKIYDDVNRYLLRFSFYDGSILNVCPNSDESISALNIKKGILSAFQNKMKRFDIDKSTSEKDINGLCPTTYNLERIKGTTLVVRKIKDISNCLERCQLHSVIPTSKFIFQSKFHKWTPLNSTVVCHQTIDHSIPVHIQCQEEHMLKILPNQTYSSRTLINQEFQLVSEIHSYVNIFTFLHYPEVTLREDLSFNHKKPKKSEITELEESEALLLQLCNITSIEFQLNTADLFTKFIHTARHLSFEALEILLEKSSSLCPTGRKHVQDSLPFLRSTAALSLMKDLIISGSIPQPTANAWLFAMSLFTRPDNEVIESVAPMLSEETASNKVLLSVSSILHSYNVWVGETDDKDTIMSAINYLEVTLNETIIRSENTDKLVLILKSLGNAGIQTESIGYTLSACIRNPTTPSEVKIAAIEAHRRLPCDFNTEALLDVYTNIEYEAEVRIVAYLQIMKCPSYAVILAVKTMLQNENLNQVGSFVWSHVKNVMKSSLEFRVHVQALLQDYTLQEKFKTDFRKYSRNYERSFYLSDYGVGGVLIGNVIFSTKTYIPTYLTLNLTLNIYGEVINVLEINVFVEGLERYAEKLFEGGTDFLTEKLGKLISSYRFLRSYPITIKEKIKYFFKHMLGTFPEPTISVSARLFGNEFAYTSCRGQDGIRELVDIFDMGNIFERFLNGKEITYDYSTVFMDMSYVSPTGAGVPLNLNTVGISIINFNTSIFMNFTDFSMQDFVLIEGKYKPRLSINFEGSMGTDLVYEQTQVQVRNKMYTSSEVEGCFLMDTIDNVSLSFNLPQRKFDIFSFHSDLYYKNNDLQKHVILQDTSDISDNITCFWPLLEQSLGLSVCSTYYTSDPDMMLQSLMHVLKGPFKFSLFMKKADPSAKIYVFKYNKRMITANDSSISIGFETPGSIIPRNMKTQLYVSPENNNLTIHLHANKTRLQAGGYYKNTPNDKVLNFVVDINGLRQVDLIIELHIKRDKKDTQYMPKLYFAISSKSVMELAGTFRWTDKTGTSFGDANLQFKTNKFDSLITGTISATDNSVASHMQVNYKFKKVKNESLRVDFFAKDLSNNLKTSFLGDVEIQSSSYPEMNLRLDLKYQKSHDHLDVRVDYVTSPFETDNSKKLTFKAAFSYLKSFNGLKGNIFIEIKKPSTDVNMKFALFYQNNPTTSNLMVLIRYAKEKDIVAQFKLYSPRSPLMHHELRFNATIPSTRQPMVVQIRLSEKSEKEYEVDFAGTWFSGHTAMAAGLLQDKSTHYASNYFIKVQLRSRLFNHIVIITKIISNELERKVTITAEHNGINYAGLARHTLENDDMHEIYIEYIYNKTASYSLKNRLNLVRKDFWMEIHLDKFRDVHLAAKGRLERWNSNVGMEVRWDANRDSSQKLVITFNTNTLELPDSNQYEAKIQFEYPGHVSAASFSVQHRGNYRSLLLALEINPSSIVELLAFSENELLNKGFMEVGFKFLTPFENWRETAFFSGMYCEKQRFRTNGNLTWQGDQNIVFDTRAGYKLNENITSFTFASFLNSTLQDLSALAFTGNYTNVKNQVHLSFLLQPNAKYSLYVSTTAMIKYFTSSTEYAFHIRTKTPFLEYYDNEFASKLKLMTQSRIIGETFLRLNDDIYTIFVKGYLNFFERSKLCMFVQTPFEKFDRLNGLLFYDFDEKHIYLDFTGQHFNATANAMYLYNNISNFNVRLEIMSPLKSLNKLSLITMYNGNTLELRTGWNTFNLGFAGVQRFSTWTDLEYGVHIYTPIETFKESEANFKLHLTSAVRIVTARVILSNVTKVGVNFAYNSDKNKTIYVDECESLYEGDITGIFKTVILANGLFELDTLIYPTIRGVYRLDQSDNRYTLDAKLAVFYLKIDVWNHIDYDSPVSFNNSFSLTSSIDMYSDIRAHVMMKNVTESKTHVATDFQIIRFNQTYKGAVEVFYEYQSIDAALKQIKYGINGLHNIAIKLNTPFDRLEEAEMTVQTRIDGLVFRTSVKMKTKYTTISLTGNLQLLESFFGLNVNFDVNSVYISLPAFRLQILRDFSQIEKRIAFILEEPIDSTKEFHDFFCIRSSWYIDNRDHISLSGEIITPLKILNELKCSLLYTHEIVTETYYLEAYMKYSNMTEMKARAHLKPPNATLNLESSMEGLKNAHFMGTLERTGPGHQKIDAIMITNGNFRIQGSSSVTDLTPFAIKGRLLRGKDGIELSRVEMAVRKKKDGYNVIASLYSKGKSLNVETDITNFPNDVRVINLAIRTGKGDYEYLNVNAELKLQHPGIYLLTVKGDTTMNEAKGSSLSKVEIWFRNGTAAAFASIDSGTLKGRGEVFAAWRPPNFIYACSNIHFVLENQLTEIFDGKLHFFKNDETFNNFTSGLMVDLNKKWMLEANTTVIISSSNDVQMATHFILPNTNAYSVVTSLKYNNDYNLIQHLVAISRPTDTPCYTISDVNLAVRDVHGMFAFKCGIKDTLFMMDNFSGQKTTNELVLRNWLRSNTLSDALVTNVNYTKNSPIHVVHLKFLYPPKKEIALADVVFESTDNFDCFINTTTPYSKLRHFVCEINCKTTNSLYQRYGKIYLQSKPALVNITHVKRQEKNGMLNDGQIRITFPVTTWHEGILKYTYSNSSVDLYINGSMEAFYNSGRLINGTFTKNSTKVFKYDRDITHLKLSNILMPVSVVYMHEKEPELSKGTSHDFKRIEVSKLKDTGGLNLTGEALTDTIGTQEWTSIRLLHFNRSLTFKSYTDGGNAFENGIFVNLKPEIWFHYDLKTNKTVTNTTFEKIYDLNLAYPRRNFSFVSDFSYGEKYINSQFVLHNFLTQPTKTMGLNLRTEKVSQGLRETTAVLFHPSFQKNVTMFISFHSLKTVLANMTLNLEYSNDELRKLDLCGSVVDKSTHNNRQYVVRLNGKHPATRFKLDVVGSLRSKTGDHYIGNNISYIRSFLPEQYWNGKAVLNMKDNIVEVERISTRAMIVIRGDYKKSSSKHVINTLVIEGTNANTHMSGNFEIDVENKEINSIVNLTSDASDRLQIEGSIPENKEARFNIWRTYNEFHFPQLTFFVTLNHSRFFSSALLWRTDIGINVLKTVRSAISYLWASGQEGVEFWTQFLRSESSETLTAVWTDMKPEVEDFVDDLHNMKSVQDNMNYFKRIFNESYNSNEFFLKDIHTVYNMMTHNMSFVNTIESFPKIVGEIIESMGETSQVIRNSLIWMVNTIRELYEQLLSILDQLVEGKAEEYVATFVQKGSEKFDNFIKEVHISLISTLETTINEFVSVLSHYQMKLLIILEPTFMEIVHHIDSTFWDSSRKLIDFIYMKKDDFWKSPYLLRSANFTHRLDAIYKDLIRNDLVTNVKKYSGLFYNAFYEYYVCQIPYREELMSVGNEIISEIKELYKLPLVAYTVDNIQIMYNQVVWVYEYFDISMKLQKLIPFVYKQLQENTITALEFQLKSQKPKTKFIFMPENGIIKLEQKLPFPWHAFNETPIYEELEEYKYLKNIQIFLTTSRFKIWYWYKTAMSLMDPQQWLPPFKAHAQLIGFNNYITFDSVHVPFYGNYCQYLLSHDFVDEKFSLILNSDDRDSRNQQSISLLLGPETITIQFNPIRITIGTQKVSKFPIQLNQTYVYFDHDIITVESQRGVTLKCNVYYRLCTMHLSGWFFGKVAGLLGTVNNEPSDDIFKGQLKSENYLWSLSPERPSCPFTSNRSMVPPDYGVNEKCNKLFTTSVNISSPFESCFSEVNPAPYYEICIIDLNDDSVCSVAMAYVQSCFMNSVPLRIPTFCVKCPVNNRYAEEGTFIPMEGSVSQSSDIVFIVEAKPCHHDLIGKKNLQILINAISKEFVNSGYTNNRYSLVVFGGEGIDDKPHSVIIDNSAFATNTSHFMKYFESIRIGVNGSSDVFGALRFATKLSLRIGVSKTFILLLCSNCDPINMELDYSVLHHALIEKSIILHILMDESFPSDQSKSGKLIFGLDSYTAYTKSDIKGDRDLHQQTKLTKALLGYCTPLALESNGTLFTSKPLSDNRLSKKFVSVFAKRVALTANPSECQVCECHSDNNGIPYVECTSCLFPTPINFDFNEDEDDIGFPPTIMNFDSDFMKNLN